MVITFPQNDIVKNLFFSFSLRYPLFSGGTTLIVMSRRHQALAQSTIHRVLPSKRIVLKQCSGKKKSASPNQTEDHFSQVLQKFNLL